MRRGLANIVPVQKQQVLRILSVCVCSLRYPACNAHAPYCYLCPAPLYNIFPPHYLINSMIFGKKTYWKQNVCFDVLYNFCSKRFSF